MDDSDDRSIPIPWRTLLTADPIDRGGEVVFGEGLIGIAGEQIRVGDVIEVDLSVPPHRRILRPWRKD